MVRGWIVPEWLERDVTQGQSQQSPPVMSRRLSFLCSDSSAGHRRIYVPPAVKLRRRMVTPAAAAVQQFQPSWKLPVSREPSGVLFRPVSTWESAEFCWRTCGGGERVEGDSCVFPSGIGAETAPGNAEDVT